MKYLLDTHVFLWFVSGDPRLPSTFRSVIQNPANTIFLSVVSVWEAVIKFQLGKLPLPAAPDSYLPLQRIQHGINRLPIEEAAFPFLVSLPMLHRDPFDRLMMAQALQHDLTLMTVDSILQACPVKLLASS